MAEKIEVKARGDGPLVIQGSAIYTEDGEEQKTSGTAVALCRCGGSAQKPFCDGTHRTIGFQAEEVVFWLTPEA
jgi:CDGSH-type Zn-finger protein